MLYIFLQLCNQKALKKNLQKEYLTTMSILPHILPSVFLVYDLALLKLPQVSLIGT